MRALTGVPPAARPPEVVRIEPPDGARGVLRDCPVVVRLSHPVDPATLQAESFCVATDGNSARGGLRSSPDGRLLVWTPEQPLTPDVPYRVLLSGLRDQRGRILPSFASCFTSCDLASTDLSP